MCLTNAVAKRGHGRQFGRTQRGFIDFPQPQGLVGARGREGALVGRHGGRNDTIAVAGQFLQFGAERAMPNVDFVVVVAVARNDFRLVPVQRSHLALGDDATQILARLCVPKLKPLISRTQNCCNVQVRL